MNSLKHELRQLFDSGRSLNIFDDTEHLEEGLLERIINLSILNPGVFPSQPWDALAVKSSLSKQKLSGLCGGDEKLPVCAVCLIILGRKDLQPLEGLTTASTKQLLEMSIMYASKYYSVDFHVVKSFDAEGIKKYFNIGSDMDIEMVTCLGYFGKACPAFPKEALKSYSQAIREV